MYLGIAIELTGVLEIDCVAINCQIKSAVPVYCGIKLERVGRAAVIALELLLPLDRTAARFRVELILSVSRTAVVVAAGLLLPADGTVTVVAVELLLLPNESASDLRMDSMLPLHGTVAVVAVELFIKLDESAARVVVESILTLDRAAAAAGVEIDASTCGNLSRCIHRSQ